MNIISIIIIALSLSACASSGTQYSLAVKAESHKLEVIESARAPDAGTIYAPKDMYFTHVDGKEQSGVKYLGLGLSGFPTALTINSGNHNLQLWKNGRPHFDLKINNLIVKQGSKYFVNYITQKIDDKVQLYFWVEDLNTGLAVYGRKRTLDELNNKKPKDQ